MTTQDLHRVNMLISRSFTQGRYDDGYQVTHVPMCRPEFLEMYYWSCPEGCFVIEENNKIIAASFCHVWGNTGWIGPLAVTPENHLLGYGKQIARKSLEYLKDTGCKTIGLEANPRSSRNLGFYGHLELYPASLSVDMMRKASTKSHPKSPHEVYIFSQGSDSDRIDFLAGVRLLCKIANPDIDYSPLVQSLYKFKYGESILFVRNNVPIGVTIMQTVPTSSEEDPSLLRIIAMLAHPRTPESYYPFFFNDIERFAADNALTQMLIRVPTSTELAFRFLLARRFRVIYSDMRLTLHGYPEKVTRGLFHVSRWA